MKPRKTVPKLRVLVTSKDGKRRYLLFCVPVDSTWSQLAEVLRSMAKNVEKGEGFK